MHDFETSSSKSEVSSVENYFFLEKYSTSEGAVFHNVLYYMYMYQPLPITHYQVRFYANNYFK